MKHLHLIILCLVTMSVQAQRLSHDFQNTSLSEALIWIDNAQDNYKLNFIFDELEDFTVTTQLKNVSVRDAVRQVCGFYPMHLTFDAQDIYIECVQKSDTKLTGRIINESGQPVAYASITLLSLGDSTFLTGGVSNEAGDFVIPCKEPKVIARISYVGYKTVYKTCTQPEVGTIRLQPDNYTLKGVTVKGHVPQYQMGSEGLVTNVESTPLSQLGTASDVLKHVPGIIQKDDGYEVFGKGTPIIYINGRLMRNAKELEQLKSTDIKNIELITNPGAKYDATVGAVVKIQTVRKAGDGFSIDTWGRWKQGRKDHEAASLDMNYRNNGLDIFASLWASKGNHLQWSELTQEVQTDTLWQQRNDMKIDITSRDYSIETGFNYMLNEHHSFGAKYEYSFPTNNDETTTLTSDVTTNGEFYDKWENLTQKQTQGNAKHKLNAYYIGKVGKLDIDWNFDYLHSGYDEQSKIAETCQIQDDRTIDAENRVRNRMLASKLTMTYPLFGGSLDFGAEYINTDRQDDYVNPQGFVASTYSTLKEQSISPYAEYSIMMPKIGQFRMGLRYEHVNFDYYESGRLIEDQSRSYSNLYPSLSFGTQIGKVMAQIGYSAKTTRPTYRQLSNDVFYVNRYGMQRGNPLLDNSVIHNVSIQGMWKFMQFSIDYSDERGRIIHWMEQIDNSNVTLVTYKNINSLKWIVPYVSLAPQFGIWHPQLAVGFRKQWFSMETTEGDISLNKLMLVGQANNTFRFSKTLTGELNFRYQGPGHYQNIYLDYHQAVLNVSIVKTFFNDRLSIKLAGEDLFDRSRDGNLVYNHQIKLWQGNYHDRRRFVATIRYKFNTTRSKYKGTGAGNAEKSRL
ncbi:MAG: TonB-dependent receptor family protein [Prevotella sp.]|nr:TonB-dependent receptor family protein [Prevotella sp.]